MKSFSFLLILAILLITFANRETILFKLGTFLLVDEPAQSADVAIVSDGITEKVVACYHSGGCPKIYVFLDNMTDTWKVLRKINMDALIREEAREKGIKDQDLVILSPKLIGASQNAEYLKSLFDKNKIRSAVFYLPYYKTRNQRFYLDRHLGASGVKFYVQSLDNRGTENFVRWWENTMLDNLFADEYMEILFYYFNKALWSPVV